MLRRLRIENLVLIREAELELDEGLNAITGETGAGKTILSNAIGLLLGARGDAALIGAAGDEAYVEAEFDGVDDEALGSLAELRPDGEDGARPRAADLRRRPHARLRLGSKRRARGRRRGGRGADRDERPVRAAPPRAARLPARRARRLRRAGHRVRPRGPGASSAPPGAPTTS